MSLTGSTDVTGAASTHLDYRFSVHETLSSIQVYQLDVIDTFATFDVSFNVTIGKQYLFSWLANGEAESTTPTSSARLHETILWGGIDSLTIAGVAVDYRVASVSGFNWALPAAFVPKPAPLALLALALGALVVSRRRTGSAA